MAITEIITNGLIIIAILLGPIIAVRLEGWLDKRRERRERKLNIFKTLMATRSYNLSWDHVITLNKIDLEFNGKGKKEKAVIEAWKAYHDHLGDSTMEDSVWGGKKIELFVELLHKMAQVMGYDFDKTHIKNSSYAPQVHSDLDKQNSTLRKYCIDVLEGKRSIPIVVSDGNPKSKSNE